MAAETKRSGDSHVSLCMCLSVCIVCVCVYEGLRKIIAIDLRRRNVEMLPDGTFSCEWLRMRRVILKRPGQMQWIHIKTPNAVQTFKEESTIHQEIWGTDFLNLMKHKSVVEGYFMFFLLSAKSLQHSYVVITNVFYRASLLAQTRPQMN